MRIIAYIDGFNLYYGCLRDTPFKWLDIYKLCHRIAEEQYSPQTISLQSVKFFTADVKANLSNHGTEATHSQNTYHRALGSLHPSPEIEIIKGTYSIQKAFFYPYKEAVPPAKKAKINLSDEKVVVWRPEEKKTDVNIALHMYRDAVENNCDTMMIFTNDTDMAPAIEFVKSFNPGINIGVIFPIGEKYPGRPGNAELSSLTDWTRNIIRDEELSDSKMNDLVPTHKKPAIKPSYW